MKNTLFLLFLLPLLAFGQETPAEEAPPEAYSMIREALANPDSVTELDLSGYSMGYLPPEIGELTNLEKLWLQDNNLEELPPSIGNLRKLTQLKLTGNRLNALPKEFWRLSSLERLWLNNNSFSDLDDKLGKLSSLKWLILDDNPLTALPSTIERLVHLEELWLQEGQLAVLPESLTKLESLKKLMLWGNPLQQLPVSLSNLSGLTVLDLRHTPVKITDVELARLTWEMDGCDIRYDEQAILEEAIESEVIEGNSETDTAGLIIENKGDCALDSSILPEYQAIVLIEVCVNHKGRVSCKFRAGRKDKNLIKAAKCLVLDSTFEFQSIGKGEKRCDIYEFTFTSEGVDW